jgi:hypothetical protein
MANRVTFRLPAAAYEIIQQEAVLPGDASTLDPKSRDALRTAAPLPEGVWVVDCTEQVSRDIEDWLKQTAAVESAISKGEGRYEILTKAVRAIKDGRQKSSREHGAR